MNPTAHAIIIKMVLMFNNLQFNGSIFQSACFIFGAFVFVKLQIT
jgi:hypothetical protein